MAGEMWGGEFVVVNGFLSGQGEASSPSLLFFFF